MRRGEVRWYKFPKPDKNRPVLILTRTSILDYLGEVTVRPSYSHGEEHPQRSPAFHRRRCFRRTARELRSSPDGVA